jgi:diguanylate cyclase (GGDEF)-like protein
MDKNIKFILLIVLGIYIIIPVYDYYSFQRFENINYSNLVLESITALFALGLLFAIQIEKQFSKVNWPLNIGMFLLVLSTFVDAIDQIFIHSILFTVIFEKASMILAYCFILLGILRWKKNYNELLLTDNLTKIPNRMAIDQFVDHVTQVSDQDDSSYYFAIIDIDYFKNINDKYGHKVGDNVLVEFSQLLKAKTKPNDKIGRWGGEEFIMIMENTTTYQAKLSLDNLREGISQHKFIQDIKSIDFTVSIGLTRWQKDDSGFETLFLRADRALYEAKNAGRNCVVVNIDSKDQ